MTENMLTRGLKYTGTVMDIKDAAESFPSTKGESAGQLMYCHFISFQVNGFPHPHKLQICNVNQGIIEFQKGDDIKVIVTGHNMTKDMYSVKFDSVVMTKMKKTTTEYLKNTGQGLPAASKIPQGEPNTNPMVAGSLWSVCLTAAIALHKDDVTPKKTPGRKPKEEDEPDPRVDRILESLHQFRNDYLSTHL